VDLEHLLDIGRVHFETGFIELGEHGFLEGCWCFQEEPPPPFCFFYEGESIGDKCFQLCIFAL
jgi:hypothetical protein